MATCRTALRDRMVMVAVCGSLVLAAQVLVVPPAEPAGAQAACAYWPVGGIAAKYEEMGGAAGPLGCAEFAGERSTPDGAGRYTRFAGGSIYWTSGTGAHVVWGAIRDKWAALGWERSHLGYPLTDEVGTPDGVGAYNVFQGGSIYWSPSTGAHEVRGAIRDAWASLGWELGDFGYPTSDEIDAPDGLGRLSEFQRGRIYWASGFTCTVDDHEIPVNHTAGQEYAAETGRRRCGELWRQLTDLIVGGRYVPHARTDIEFRLCGDCPPGWVSGTSLSLSAGFVNTYPDDVGLLAHELAHVAQSYPNGLGWGTEGIADWVRYALGLPPPGHAPGMSCQGGHHYSEGYECAATFLDYLDRQDPGDLIRDLNAYGHGGGSDIDAWLAVRLARPLSTIWSDCRATQCAGGRAGATASAAEG